MSEQEIKNLIDKYIKTKKFYQREKSKIDYADTMSWEIDDDGGDTDQDISYEYKGAIEELKKVIKDLRKLLKSDRD